MSKYAKMIIALVGTAATTLLGLIPDGTTLWITLTVIAAVITTAGVYAVPNEPTADAAE